MPVSDPRPRRQAAPSARLRPTTWRVGLALAAVVAAATAAVSTAAVSTAAAQRVPTAASAESLFGTVAGLDGALFAAYNRCDLAALGAFVTDDLEFYHDQTGLARGRQALVDGVRLNVCGKVRRDLVPGTLEVHPLRGYGAVETGEHRFCDPRAHRTCTAATGGAAKFVMVWQHQADGAWRLTRVISYDHAPRTSAPAEPGASNR